MKEWYQRLARRFRFFFEGRYWPVVGLSGVVFVVIAAALAAFHPFWAGVSGGIGGSILATVIVSFAGPAGEEVYQNFLKLGVVDFYGSRHQVPNDKWVTMLQGATMHCTLLGHAHGEWCRDTGFKPALISRLQAGVRVEIFFLNPTGTGVKLRMSEDSLGERNTILRIQGSIRALWVIREGLEQDTKKRLTLYVYDATPSLGVTWIDTYMLVTHYLPGSVNLTSPALVVEPRSGAKSMYSVYEENVKRIRESYSKEITSENIDSLITE